MRIVPEVRRLPSSYASAIGRVLARWSYEEWLLERILYRLLAVDPRRAGKAVRALRPDERVAMIRDLVKARGLTVAGEYSRMKTGLRRAKAERDLLAHGLWLRHPETGRLHIWWMGRRRAAGAKARPIPKTARDLRATYRELDRLIALTRRMEKDVTAALRARR